MGDYCVGEENKGRVNETIEVASEMRTFSILINLFFFILSIARKISSNKKIINDKAPKTIKIVPVQEKKKSFDEKKPKKNTIIIINEV